MDTWTHYVERYRRNEAWRDQIFRDMVLEDARRMGGGLTILDIGCGRGLDGSIPMQRSIAEAASRFVGIEPDREVDLGDYFHETYRCTFEETPLPANSVHLAYAVMVLEHLPSPETFWDKLWETLVDGGVFWGLTVDGRHPFTKASLWAERLKAKNLYLNWLSGARGRDRYENYPTYYQTNTPTCSLTCSQVESRHENYPTYYRTNTPGQIDRLAGRFQSRDYINFSRVGQMGGYLPRRLRPVANAMDRRAIRTGRPGPLLAVRVAK
jgi:SAM-dependent methyltransferase